MRSTPRPSRLPAFVRQVPTLLRRYGLKLVIGGLVVGGVGYAALRALAPAATSLTPQRPAATPRVSAIDPQQAMAAQKEQQEQFEDAKIRAAWPKVEKALEGLKTQLDRSESQRQKEQQETTGLKELVASLQQQLAAQRTAQQQASHQPGAPPPEKKAAHKPTPTPTAPLADIGSRIFVFEPKGGADKGKRLTPRANALDTAHVPAWSFAPVRVIFGGQASSRERSGIPMLLGVTGPVTGPHQLQGPGRDAVRTALEVQGCLVGGFGGADLAASRVLIQTVSFVCVLPNGETFTRNVNGVIVGKDGLYGIPAKVDHHASAQELKLFLTAMLQEVAALVGLAKSQVIVTPYSSGPQPGQGTQTLLQKTGELYLKQMEYLLPTLTAWPNTDAFVLFQEEITLEGYPVDIHFAQGASTWRTY